MLLADWLTIRTPGFFCSRKLLSLVKIIFASPFLKQKKDLSLKKKSHVQFSHFLPQDSPITTIFYRYFLASDSETVESSYRYVYTTVYSLT